MFLRLNYCDLVMLTDLDSVYAKKLKTLGVREEKEKENTDGCTVSTYNRQ